MTVKNKNKNNQITVKFNDEELQTLVDYINNDSTLKLLPLRTAIRTLLLERIAKGDI